MRIPKKYALPNHEIAADHYVPPRTTDELEADYRRSVRETHSVITYQQGLGTEVVRRTMSFVRQLEEEETMARMAGGTMLLTANYLMNSQQRNVMYRNIAIPPIAKKDSPIMTPDEFDDDVEADLVRLRYRSFELAARLGDGTFTKKAVMGLGRTVAELGVSLANYPLDTSYYDEVDQDVALFQSEVVRNATKAHDAAIDLARKIGTVPSLAQYADPQSPLSVELTTNREHSIKLVRSFKDAQESVLEEQ